MSLKKFLSIVTKREEILLILMIKLGPGNHIYNTNLSISIIQIFLR